MLVDGGLTVTDLGSTNGTTLNGMPVTEGTRFRPGDVIGLGGVEIEALPVVAE